jgi:RluA family pseudouridine synthase
MIREWKTTDLEDGQTLQEALALRIPAAPRAFLRQLCKKGRVLCDGQLQPADFIIDSGRKLSLNASARCEEFIIESQIPPEAVLFEDPSVLALNKPAGLAVHHAKGHDDDLQSRARHFLYHRQQPYQIAPAHRLDIGTSGPVLFGKGRRAIGQLGRLFMTDQVDKRYLAMVQGRPSEQGRLQSPVTVQGRTKEASTDYRRLAVTKKFSLLSLQLQTGRQHQIRQQLAEAGWPICGDHRYGGPNLPNLNRPFLHCNQLGFPSLMNDRQINLCVDLPEELTNILDHCGFPSPVPVDTPQES